MGEERYGTPDAEVDIERRRLGLLAAWRDPYSIEALRRVGIGLGMRCLEIGAGAGTMSAWMADEVGPTGSVVSTDVDLRFHVEVPDNVEVRRVDLEHDPLPGGGFDLIHGRAVLQHLASRDEVVARLAGALRPGGWLVVEDGQFLGFAEQTLPEPYATVHRVMCDGDRTPWRDPNYGLRALAGLRAAGLVELDVWGFLWAMRPGHPSGEWWFLALERSVPRLVAAGVIDEATGAEALAQVRDPEFLMLSATSIVTVGRRPG